MKKYLTRLLLVFVTAFILVGGVDAALDCGIDGTPVIINKAGIKPDGFEVKVPYCKYSKDPIGYGSVGGWYDSYQSAYDHGVDTEVRQFEDADAKGTHLETVYVCSSNKRKVKAKYSCTAKVSPESQFHEAVTCASRNSTNCTTRGTCTWNSVEEKCEGGNYSEEYTTYKCPDGYGPTSNVTANTRCTKSWESTPVEVSGNERTSDAERACENANSGADCYDCTVEYQLYCPIHKCELNYQTINACNQTFTVNGNPAYCVNPSQGFNVSVNGNPNYKVDDAFDVDSCANSYSVVDCGYANILIEGAYYNKPAEGHSIPDSAINLALRLWGAHTGQAGFDKTGLAYLTGDDCTKPIYFKPYDGTHYANVYKFTHDYIMTNFYAIAKKYDHIPSNEKYMTGYDGDDTRGRTFEKIACDRSNNRNLLGIACGDNVSYRIAFELYFNTLIGNKHMKDHLAALVGGDKGAKPTGATIQSGTEVINSSQKETTWVEVTFEQEISWEKIKGEEIDCTKLDEMVRKGEITEEIKNQIKPYCQVKVEIYDEDGKLIVNDLDIAKCYKGSGCTTKTFELAVCDVIRERGKELQIRVTYKKTESNYTIRKYQSCSNANTNQVMFAYIEMYEGKEVDHHVTNTEEIGREEVTKSFAISNYKCSGGCENAQTRVDELVNSCRADKTDYTYGKVYTSKVKDPSLNCIVDLKDPQQKTQFDYSKYFGVNTNFCRVYCSDEVEYYIADKVHAISGRTFKYDIEFTAYGSKNVSHLLSSSVKVKRSCTSEIFYDQLPKTVDWKTIYGLTDDEYNTFKANPSFATLFNVLKAKAARENNRFENLNQIVYDLYNCNFYAKSKIDSNNITQPKENTTGNVRDRITKIYSASNDYGINSDSNGNAKKTGNKSYQSTAYVYYDFAAVNDESNRAVSPITNTATFDGSFSGITYCSDTNGSLCFNYTGADHDKESYNYKTGTTTSAESTYTFNGRNVKVPTNDYAMFTVNTKVDFYNNSLFQATEKSSGTVVKGNSNESLITIDKYSYPIDKVAYNSSACNKDGITVENPNSPNDKRCEMYQVINPLLFYRLSTNDNLTNTVKKNNKFKCYVDLEIPEPSQSSTVYRNVDPSNLFPSTNGSPKPGSNWDTDEGRKAAEEIQNNAEALTTTNDLLEYKITLTPTQIKNIKTYNERNGVYSNEITYNCTKVDNSYYINCKTGFMDILRGSNTLYSAGEYGTLDSNYNGL